MVPRLLAPIRNICISSPRSQLRHVFTIPFPSMSGSRYYIRRLKNLTSSSSVQLLTICFCAFFAIRWVIRHNHANDLAAKYKTLTISIDTVEVDWFKLFYVQYVTTEEELCNALIVWSEIEEIGSRAQVCRSPMRRHITLLTYDSA
jgi:hypothetical protein